MTTATGLTVDLVFTWDPTAPTPGGWTPEEHAEERIERAAIQEDGRAPGEPVPPLAELPEGADPDRPPPGWTFCRSGRLAGCWVGPGGELVAGPPSTPSRTRRPR